MTSSSSLLRVSISMARATRFRRAVLRPSAAALATSRSFSTAASTTSTSSTSTETTWDLLDPSTQELVHAIDSNNNNNNTPQNSHLETTTSNNSWWKQRVALSKAITLLESSQPQDMQQAELFLTHLLERPHPETFKVGIAGPPGAGKSTFIEAFGRRLLDQDLKRNKENNKDNEASCPSPPDRLAVVCVDPSSTLSGGAILGDKTRMQELSKRPNVFVRPAPSTQMLGGLAPRTDDVLRLLGTLYPLVLLETVGLGQSELDVTQTVDMVVLLVPPAGGDDLQGVKKGIVEVADLCVVTKADGTLLPAARHTAADYRGALQFGSSKTPVVLASSVTGDGLDEIWQHMMDFKNKNQDQWKAKRMKQREYWTWKNVQWLMEKELLQQQRQQKTNGQPSARDLVMESLRQDTIPPRVAAARLLQAIREKD